MRLKKRMSWDNLNKFVYRNFRLSLDYLKKAKNYFWFSLILFFCIGIFGYLFPVFFEEQILKIITELIEKTEGLSGLQLIKFIFINNLKSGFFAMIFGIFLGIVPFIVAIMNGYVLGFVANKTIAIEGILVLWRLLPHGIFEIPAIMISIGLGLRLGLFLIYNCIIFYNKNLSRLNIYLLIVLSILFFPISLVVVFVLTLMSTDLRIKFLQNFKNSLRVFVFIVVPLLILAAIIEGVLIVFLEGIMVLL